MSQPFNILNENRSEQPVLVPPSRSLEKTAIPSLICTHTFSWRSPPQDVGGDVGLYKGLQVLLSRGLTGSNWDYP
ncbi:MAG: hypothetical protein ACFFCZ_09935 [Promethearchaeota archaeon]